MGGTPIPPQSKSNFIFLKLTFALGAPESLGEAPDDPAPSLYPQSARISDLNALDRHFRSCCWLLFQPGGHPSVE
jgi:hypothetical protein